MLSKNPIIVNFLDIPKEWVFEYYLNLSERLSGQSIKMKSIFNNKDKIPSMCIYTNANDEYRFKDFSSSYQGDGVELVRRIFNYPNRSFTMSRIIGDYNEYLSNNNYEPLKYKIHSKYGVSDYEIRHWTMYDKTYWQMYKLNSSILETYNVHPLSFFNLTKEEDNKVLDSMKIESNFLYGYFREDGTLYKVYMPKNKNKKFLKVRDYIQGTDQLEYKSKYLIILSSLKDLMCFKLLGINNIECIAPDSENSMIHNNIMKTFIEKYNKIFILFDNDEPGIKSAKKYEKQYQFSYINLELSKDLSDSIKDYGIDKVRSEVFQLLKSKL